MKLSGVVTSTLGLARTNIEAQRRFFEDLPHLDKLHSGTINMDISPRKFSVLRTDFHYPGVSWGPLTEDFEFIEVKEIVYLGKAWHLRGYLYLPSESPNRLSGHVLEVWTEKMEGIRQGTPIDIVIADGFLKLD